MANCPEILKTDFYALDENGVKLTFECSPVNGGFFLTLRKEAFRFASTLSILPSLSSARIGDPGFYVVPRSVDIEGDQLVLFNEKPDCSYTVSSPLLYALFISAPSFCGILIFERNYRLKFVTEVNDGRYSCFARLVLGEKETVYDDLRVEAIPFDRSATYSQMAVYYRELMLSRGEYVSLKEKCRRDCVDYARRAPLIRVRMGWKQSPSPVLHQNDLNEPDMKVACDFKRVREFADALRERGVEAAEIQLVGWNASGHDGRFPQLLPVDPRFGGEEELTKTFDHLKKLGYRVSLHTNSIDMTEIADCFTWDDAAIGTDGRPIQIGHYSGGLAYRVCMKKQLKNAFRDLPAVAAFSPDGLHFVDVVSIVEPDRCYSPDHPCTTSEGVECARRLMSYAKRLFGGFSSEGCMDFSLRDLDFGLYVTFGSGFKTVSVPTSDRLIPFYEIIIHGVILYNPTSPTVNYTIKSPSDRLTFFMRGGRPAMYLYSRFRTGHTNWMGDRDLVCDTDADLAEAADNVALAAREYASFADRQLVFMDAYDILDNGVHVASYRDGVRMVGNFSDEEKVFEGRSVPPFGFILV
ncbi:MAG: hypothetical protein IJV00_07700 [Clostridia bacterium]|nr:hypothetical protein [Clostridia bacterium]